MKKVLSLILALVIYGAFEVIGHSLGTDVMMLGAERWLTVYLAQLLLVVILYLQRLIMIKRFVIIRFV